MKTTNKTLKQSAENYTLLYVEDDEILRNTTLEFFDGLFKEVVIAKDGKEGLSCYNEYFDKKGYNFNLVITDIRMPNMDGIDLSRKILELNKNQKVIIVSAYNETKYFIELIKIGVSGFMQKPLRTVQMLEILGETCKELDDEREVNRYIDLVDNFKWDSKLNRLHANSVEVQLTANEALALELFISNIGQKFTDLELFNHIYYEHFEKEFSSNSIKSLLKRLRKKIPEALIQTHKNFGYSFNI